MAQAATTLWHSLLTGYDAGPALAHGATPDELRALVLGQIASILVRAHGQPARGKNGSGACAGRLGWRLWGLG